MMMKKKRSLQPCRTFDDGPTPTNPRTNNSKLAWLEQNPTLRNHPHCQLVQSSDPTKLIQRLARLQKLPIASLTEMRLMQTCSHLYHLRRDLHLKELKARKHRSLQARYRSKRNHQTLLVKLIRPLPSRHDDHGDQSQTQGARWRHSHQEKGLVKASLHPHRHRHLPLMQL